MVQGGVEEGEVLGGRLLGQFDHHLAGRDAIGLQQLQGATGLMARLQQGIRGDVEEQLARQLQFAEASAGTLPAGHFQLAQAPGIACHGEQVDRRVQWAVGGAASQGFVTEDAAFGKADDGLEQAMQVAVSENMLQRAQLLGDGHEGLDIQKKRRG
ncbi:hypothetical protein D3C86_1363330 [compost metagenome]